MLNLADYKEEVSMPKLKITIERKEELLKNRNLLNLDLKCVQGTSVFSLWSNTFSNEYKEVLKNYILNEIDKIDKELGI